ncbi:ATP-dependent DNA helicase [Curvivirga aplysinae]|uniref:ATP-dependent DNA helicase n=1 Tax=Curvivirga aplysinae TaxID=2529852 RepID=UPI0012BCD11A|nr:ATP-dependent DNA helicase [Curvivirga aplysinae]MTI10743.1 ATP-dependent DNA helicase [Curvivirga aplysinae]
MNDLPDNVTPFPHAASQNAEIPAGEVRVMVPDTSILVTSATHAVALTGDGEILEDTPVELADIYKAEIPPILVHSPSVAKRMGLQSPRRCYDLLELFAFVKPAAFCLPTPGGIMQACGLEDSWELSSYPVGLHRVVSTLLEQFSLTGSRPDTRRILWSMTRDGWLWGPYLLAAIGEDVGQDNNVKSPMSGLDVWKALPEWEEQPPPPPPGTYPVEPTEARQRLADLLGQRAEDRPSQSDFSSAVSEAFTNPESEDMPRFVMAEAGTGVGKTMGYIAPASLWAEKNQTPVWLSTYTRNLQHQIDDELNRLYPDETIKQDRVVLRKGRENYLCLLNYEDSVRGSSLPGRTVGLGLMARWIAATRDGDLSGGDFPSWLPDLIGQAQSVGLSDKRGECIHSACNHYSRCFILNSIRRARYADLVVANHALVMIQTVQGGLDRDGRANRVVFDEGHHVFDAADSAFAAYLTGREMWELRRWLRGNESRARKSRIRGLKTRCEDLLGEEVQAIEALEHVLHASRILPNENWTQNIGNGQPQGPAENFLYMIHELVLARANNTDGPFSLEIPAVDMPEKLLDVATELEEALMAIFKPVIKLREGLMRRLDEKSDTLDSSTRGRIEQVAQSLEFRCSHLLGAWIEMLKALKMEATQPTELFVDWLGIEKISGRPVDVGYYRHWLDPTKPFAGVVAKNLSGVLLTSATLTDGSGDVDTDWARAEERTGANHLPDFATRAKVPSPFDYPNQTKVLVVTDVRKDDLDLVGAAYRELMLASGGGALGLFTAISRLRAVHERIVKPIEQQGYPLYSQHIDALNLPTLIDIFRAETDSCLLGTDAVRDGVDVPGDSLRLIIFDRVPWSRPTILHKARKNEFGGAKYEDMLTRLKLKQAFGRLVRRGNDKGVFVLLDPMMPSRLAGAFPEGVEVERVGLADAIQQIKGFFPDH